MKKINVSEIQKNPFDMIGKEWMLISASKDGKTNTMTASWGGVGILWSKPVATCYIRPQRYTKEFVDASEMLTLSFFDGDYMKELTYLGRNSGRDGDKIAASGLTLTEIDGQPTFAEAKLVLICKKLYQDEITPDGFASSETDAANYPDKDYHTMYISEIVAAYAAE